MVLIKCPKILTGAKPEILIQCKPNFFVLFKNLKILTSKSRPWVFGVKKHCSYEIPQDFGRCLTWNCNIYNVGPKSLHSLKIPRFCKAKWAIGFWLPITWFLWNTPRFWQVLNLGFGYNVSQISLYSLKIPKILTSKSRPWVFWHQKTLFLRNTSRFWQVFYLKM